MSELEYPDELRYTAEHEWVRLSDDGSYRVGITAFAQNALGDIVYVNLPTLGDVVTEGMACGEVESTKSVSDIFAPLTGEVTAVNSALEASPELINVDPYGEGWLFDIRVDDPSGLDRLIGAETYTAQLD